MIVASIDLVAKRGMLNSVGDEDFFPLTRKTIELRRTGSVEVKLRSRVEFLGCSTARWHFRSRVSSKC